MQLRNQNCKNSGRNWLLFCIGSIVVISIMGFFIYPNFTGNWTQFLPFLLILACPLMMIAHCRRKYDQDDSSNHKNDGHKK